MGLEAEIRKCRPYLLGLEVTDDGVDVVEDLVDEGHHLAHLHLDKVSPALLGDLDEGVARHVLHAIVGLCKTLRLISIPQYTRM